METYKYVFIVLVYKNTNVLENFFENFSEQDSKVIVINSFYDEESLKKSKEIAENFGADFLQIDNKGYGYGNNIGVEYALKHYACNFLIISNSDIIIKDLSYLDEIKERKAIIAPETRMLTGKLQNPDLPWKLPLLFDITHYALEHNMKWLYTMTHVYTRLSREYFFIMKKFSRSKLQKIFAPHGSFFMITGDAARILQPIFDNNMFLYNEEWYVAMNAQSKNVPIYYCSSIKVLHLEGASSNLNKEVLFEHNKKSYNVFYKKFFGLV